MFLVNSQNCVSITIINFQFIFTTLQRNITQMPPIPYLSSILSALALLLSSVVSLLSIPFKWNNRLKSLTVCFCIDCSF